MNNPLSTWWNQRNAVEKVAVAVGAGALGVGLGCAVVLHGIVVVTPKMVLAIGPVAKTVAKAATGAATLV